MISAEVEGFATSEEVNSAAYKVVPMLVLIPGLYNGFVKLKMRQSPNANMRRAGVYSRSRITDCHPSGTRNLWTLVRELLPDEPSGSRSIQILKQSML